MSNISEASLVKLSNSFHFVQTHTSDELKTHTTIAHNKDGVSCKCDSCLGPRRGILILYPGKILFKIPICVKCDCCLSFRHLPPNPGSLLTRKTTDASSHPPSAATAPVSSAYTTSAASTAVTAVSKLRTSPAPAEGPPATSPAAAASPTAQETLSAAQFSPTG